MMPSSAAETSGSGSGVGMRGGGGGIAGYYLIMTNACLQYWIHSRLAAAAEVEVEVEVEAELLRTAPIFQHNLLQCS